MHPFVSYNKDLSRKFFILFFFFFLPLLRSFPPPSYILSVEKSIQIVYKLHGLLKPDPILRALA